MIRKNLIYGNENIGNDIVEILSNNKECEMIQDNGVSTVFKANRRRTITVIHGAFVLECKTLKVCKDGNGNYDYVFLNDKSGLDISHLNLDDEPLSVSIEIC